jgi:hypothetical protein
MMAGLSLPLFVAQVRTDRLYHALKYFIQQLQQDNGLCHKSWQWGRLIIQFLLQVKWTSETDFGEFNKTRIRNLFQDVSKSSHFFPDLYKLIELGTLVVLSRNKSKKISKK